MNQSQFGFCSKMYYLCNTRRKPHGFLLFLAPKMAKTTSKVIKFSSNIGEMTSKIFSPISQKGNFTLNLALKTSHFRTKTTFLKNKSRS